MERLTALGRYVRAAVSRSHGFLLLMVFRYLPPPLVQWLSWSVAFWADIYPDRIESTCIWGSVLALGINDHGCQQGMNSQSSRPSFPETSLLPGKWNTQQFHKLLGMGIDCFLIVLGEGTPQRLPGWAPSCPEQNFPGGLTFSQNSKLKNCALDPKA